MAALAVLLASCDSVRTGDSTANVADCARCHGYPPPPFITGATTHPASSDCSLCHPGTVQADDVTLVPGGLHLNGTVEAAASHAIPFVTEHPAVALADIGSCTECHGADYGGGAAQSCTACHDTTPGVASWTTNCTFCHGTRTAGVTAATALAAPPDAVIAGGDQTSANPKVGAHEAHLAGGTFANALACSSCHAVPVAPDTLTHFQGGGAAADIAFSATAGLGVTLPAYEGAGGTCAVYCHGSGTQLANPAGKVSPDWTSTSLACGDCHGLPPPSGPTLAGQSAHAFHLANGAACADCHTGYSGSGVVLATHVDGVKDVVIQPVAGGTKTIDGWQCTECHTDLGIPVTHALPFLVDHAPVALADIASCTQCHGADYGGGSAQSCTACHTSDVAPGFADWTANCTFCHGTRTQSVTTAVALAAPPESVTGLTSPTEPKVGAHQAHLAAGTYANAFPCGSCHTPPGGAEALDHFAGGGTEADIVFSALASQGVSIPQYGGGTCAVYCHGSGTALGNGPGKVSPAWTSAGLACNACHGLPPATGPSIEGQGAHAYHLGKGAACADCHAGYSDSTVDTATHVDGVKNVVVGATPITGWDCATCHGVLGVPPATHPVPYVATHTAGALAGIAACTGCHGADYGGGLSGVAPSCNACHTSDVAPGFADWKENCTFCHGTRTQSVTAAVALAAPPESVTGLTSPTEPKVGAHQAHLAAGAYAGAFPCATCHVPPGGAESLTHFVGLGAQADVAFGALAAQGVASPAYAAGSCAVYCHGTGTSWPTGSVAANPTPAWTSAGLACNACHASRPATGGASGHTSGFHATTTGSVPTPCAYCHVGYVQDTTVDLVLHVDGARSVVFDNRGGGVTTLTNPGWSDCSACHTSGPTGNVHAIAF